MLAQIVIAAVIVLVGGLVIGWCALKLLGWPISTFLPAMTHANTGNMGLPLVLLAFGETGLALGIAYFFVNSISQYTVGIAISSGTFHPRQLFAQPVVWAVLVVVFVLLTDYQAPRWFNATAQILGGLTIPAMLLMLGTSLARLRLTALRQTFAVSVLRLLLGLGLGVLAIWLLELEGILAGVVLLQSVMPAAVFNYVFADRFGQQPEKVAAVVLQSTLMVALALPLLVGAAFRFAG